MGLQGKMRGKYQQIATLKRRYVGYLSDEDKNNGISIIAKNNEEEKEDKDNFIQMAIKVCKIFKVKPLKAPRSDVPSRKTACNLFCKDIRKIKKELQGVPVSKASAIISREWKKVKASEKKMKKYKNLYEEEKQRHEQALQRYQEDHMDEMEIIKLNKRCNKKTDTKTVTKTAPKAPKG